MAAHNDEDVNKLPHQVEQQVMTIVNAMSQIAHSYNILLEYGAWYYKGETAEVHSSNHNMCFYNVYTHVSNKSTTPAACVALYGYAVSMPAVAPVAHAWCIDEEQQTMLELTANWTGPTWYYGVKVPTPWVKKIAELNSAAQYDILHAFQWLSSEEQSAFVRELVEHNPIQKSASLKELIGDADIYDHLVSANCIVYDKQGNVVKITNNCLGTEDDKKLTFDIEGLKAFPNLKSIELNESNVKGDIYHLRNLRVLHECHLSDTSVSGNITAMRNLMALQEFSVHNTAVVGDLSSFVALPQINFLGLSDTNITGNMHAFQQQRETNGLPSCKIYM